MPQFRLNSGLQEIACSLFNGTPTTKHLRPCGRTTRFLCQGRTCGPDHAAEDLLQAYRLYVEALPIALRTKRGKHAANKPNRLERVSLPTKVANGVIGPFSGNRQPRR